MIRLAPALLLGAALACSPALTQADVTGKSIQSANIQPSQRYGLESGQTKGVYCDLTHTGFNHITLTWPLYQTSKTATKIGPRPAGTPGAPTPTDDQLRKAIVNARSCGLGVILKPHLELPGGEWRAHIKGGKKWQKAWNAQLVRYAKLGQAAGADTLVVGVEQKGATLNKGASDRWVGTVKAVRKAAPKLKLTYAAHTNDEALLLPRAFVKRLDYLSLTYYPRLHGSDTSVAALEASMRSDRKDYFDKAVKRYSGGGNRIVFAETGFTTVKADKQYLKRDQVTSADVDLGLQARRYEALLHFLNGIPYVKGVMLYRVESAGWMGGQSDPWFTWQGKPSETVITRWFR